MSPEEILELSDESLAEMYAAWSEDAHAAGWFSGGEQAFVDHLLIPLRLMHYERKSIATIRKIVKALMEDKNDS